MAKVSDVNFKKERYADHQRLKVEFTVEGNLDYSTSMQIIKEYLIKQLNNGKI